MREARLKIIDAAGGREVPVDQDPFTIGRRAENSLPLQRSDVSRDHAEIVRKGERFAIRDGRGDQPSRFGTYVNDVKVEKGEERLLCHRDKIRLGQTAGPEMLFLCEEAGGREDRTTTTVVGDLHQVTVLLDGLRAIGSGGVLDEVLALVLDSAMEMSGAERGFIMLADTRGELEFKLARSRGRITLPGLTFETSRKVPAEVFTSGETRTVDDLIELPGPHDATRHLGIRYIFCTPLRLVRYVDHAAAARAVQQKRIGVLYLDSREKGKLLSAAAKSALETLAGEAALAIENARLFRESEEKNKLEQELKIAAKIQQALLPDSRWSGPYFDAVGTTLPCRAIGGDFFEYVKLPGGHAGFAVADVSGKGAPAALLTAVVQGILAAQTMIAGGPAEILTRTNQVLARRAVDSRFVTMLYAALAPDGRLVYGNAGHNPPFLFTGGGIRRLDRGGTILGLFEQAPYEDEAVQLAPGDLLVAYSDGLSEALNMAGDEFGDQRILDCLTAQISKSPSELMESLLADVRAFTQGAVQSDDITILILRYGG